MNKIALVVFIFLVQVSCVFPNNAVIQEDNKSAVSEKNHQNIRFKLRIPGQFRTLCANCRVRYARLQIRQGESSQPIYAMGADENGFTPVEQDGMVQLNAQVPSGNNWTASAAFFVENLPQQKPVMEFGAAFHVGSSPAEVELSLRALQTAQIIDALHTIDSPKIFQPVDLEKMQAMSDRLLGVSQNADGTYILGNMPGARTGEDLLDATQIAQLLDQDRVSLEELDTVAELPLSQLHPHPLVSGSYRARAFTAGLSKLVFDAQSERLLGFDFLTGQRQIYTLNPALERISPLYALGEMRSLYLSLGKASESQGNEEPAYYAYLYSGLNRMTLGAYAQNRQKLLWQHTFDVNATMTDYVPTVMRLPAQGDLPARDRVYVPLNADRFNTPEQRGLYALENGQVKWSLPLSRDAQQRPIFTAGFNTAGALSPSGDHLYLVSVSIPGGMAQSELVAINTQTPGLSWRHSLGESTFTTSTPVVGTHGVVYVHSVDTSQQSAQSTVPGHLTAVTPSGDRLWRADLAVGAAFPPVVDYQAGQDVIYSLTETGMVSSFDHLGRLRWQFLLQGTAGEGPVDAPLIGQDLGGGRTLYLAMGNGLIYALRDHGEKAALLWAQAPGGKVSRGMVLVNGHLYVPTLDGGEGQFVQIKRVQVHSVGLPTLAPWPIMGGNLAGTGQGHRFYLNSQIGE